MSSDPVSSGPVKVRLAPSPTGYLHIGHAFVALLDKALVAKYGGSFLIRIEDTDQNRFVAEAEQAIYDGLEWLGLTWDAGPDKGGPDAPYRQSDRLERYRAAAEELIAKGRAYRCWCSPERLAEMRKEQQAKKQPPRYDRLCLGKTESERKQLPGYTERSVVRLLMPDQGQVSFVDAIRGEITFESALLDDRILLKSDGFPTYNLAAPVDDHAMGITHITRGEEWIPSTPAHVQVFESFGWALPTFIHVPLLLNKDRSKISKRKHPWAVVSWFRDEGYLPEAVINYLGGLAVHVPDPDNPDPSIDRDLFGFEDLVEHLDISRIGPSGKIVDLDRLSWANGQYIRRLSVPEFKRRVTPFMLKAGLAEEMDEQTLAAALPLEQARIKRLGEAPEVLGFFFHDDPYEAKQLIPKGLDKARTLEILHAARQAVEDLANEGPAWTADALKEALWPLAELLGVKTGQLFGNGAVRVAVTCRSVGPPIFETMEVLGPATVKRRLDAAIEKLTTYEPAA